MKGLVKDAVEATSTRMAENGYEKRSKRNVKDFTRKRKIGFKNAILFLLRLAKRSLQIEVEEFTMLMCDPDEYITKDAFVKARRKLKYEALEEVFQITVETVYKTDWLPKTKGYRIMAIDGSELALENTEDIRREFAKPNDETKSCARISVMTEVTTGILVDGQIASTSVSERALAMRHLEAYEKWRCEKDVILMDRGYPSKELLRKLTERKLYYAMRLQRSFNAKVDAMPVGDHDWALEDKQGRIMMRVVKIALNSGETETLITNLPRTDFDLNEMGQLYSGRWSVETRYDALKNKLQLENFSGRTALAIKQDFYATLYVANIAAMAKAEADEIIAERAARGRKPLKYEYAANENLLIGRLKNKLILALIHPDKRVRDKIMDDILEQTICTKVPIRAGRPFPPRKATETHHKKHFPRKHVI